MPRYKAIEYPSYSVMLKDAALYGLKKGLIVGGVAATLLALLKPELREHLIALYATIVPTSALVATTLEVASAPLEHRVIRPNNQDNLTNRLQQ